MKIGMHIADVILNFVCSLTSVEVSILPFNISLLDAILFSSGVTTSRGAGSCASGHILKL